MLVFKIDDKEVNKATFLSELKQSVGEDKLTHSLEKLNVCGCIITLKHDFTVADSQVYDMYDIIKSHNPFTAAFMLYEAGFMKEKD